MSKFWLSGRIFSDERHPSSSVFIMNLLLDSEDRLQAKQRAEAFVRETQPDGVASVDEWTAMQVPTVPEAFAGFFAAFAKAESGIFYQVKRFDNLTEAGNFFVSVRKALG